MTLAIQIFNAVAGLAALITIISCLMIIRTNSKTLDVMLVQYKLVCARLDALENKE